MHEAIAVGNVLEISVPKNNFVLYEKNKRFILIAGGIGITPLIAMAHRLDELDKHFEFHICAKDASEVPFKYELENWPFAPMIEVVEVPGDHDSMVLEPNVRVLAARQFQGY